MNAWLTQHTRALGDALRRLIATPLGSLLTTIVIGIALALPAAGWLLIDNLQNATRGLSAPQQISIFLNVDADHNAANAINSRLKSEHIGTWRFVPKEDALKKLQVSARMSDLISNLPKNPLPDAFIVEPTDTSAEHMAGLANIFSTWPQVAHVQLDAAWAKRLDAFLRFGRLAINMLALVFCAALVIATFNTIRLQVLAHAAEIELSRLIGATDAWIRRPFAYYGALQGLLGAILALLILAIAGSLFEPIVGELAELYGSDFSLQGPSLAHAITLLVIGAILGWLGALLSVSHSLWRENK